MFGLMILSLVLMAMLVNAMPVWRHSRNWGYLPCCELGFVILVLLAMLIMGVGRQAPLTDDVPGTSLMARNATGP